MFTKACKEKSDDSRGPNPGAIWKANAKHLFDDAFCKVPDQVRTGIFRANLPDLSHCEKNARAGFVFQVGAEFYLARFGTALSVESVAIFLQAIRSLATSGFRSRSVQSEIGSRSGAVVDFDSD
jgi:hypothetical protein